MTHVNLYVRLLAILCITILETTAMIKGINGATFGIATAGIGAIAGTTVTSIASVFKTRNKSK